MEDGPNKALLSERERPSGNSAQSANNNEVRLSGPLLRARSLWVFVYSDTAPTEEEEDGPRHLLHRTGISRQYTSLAY